MNLSELHSDLSAIVERYGRAFNDGDADSMIELFTPDTVFVNVAGNLVRGAEDLHRAQKSVFEGPLRGVRATFTVENVSVLDEGVAVVHARQENTWPAEGSGAGARTASVIVFVLTRDARGWRIRTGQNTPVAT